MSHPPPPLNPSQTVERIREIIVGRNLERLECRLALLESGAQQSVEVRLTSTEARVEALQENFHRMTTAVQGEDAPFANQPDAHRLAAHVQEIAITRAAEAAAPAIEQLERKLGLWLSEWQNAFHRYLEDRDERIATQLRGEFAALWENTDSQMTRLETKAVDRQSLDSHFSRIAAAARVLAESADIRQHDPIIPSH